MTQITKRVSKRLISNFINTWKGLSSPFSGKRLELSPYLHDDEIAPLREKIQTCLASHGGQVSARARAAELGKAYLWLNDEGKRKYLSLLVKEFDVDHDVVRKTAETLFSDLDTATRSSTEHRLREQLTPPYLTLLTQFNALPKGLKFLVDMRRDLLTLKKEYPELAPIESELRKRLLSWFDIGFLDLKRIDWNAPAALLEKLIAYETVHTVKSWIDIHHRLAENRRCFAFFHPRMPDEPLAFVWVALVKDLSDNIEVLLDTDQSEVMEADDKTAVFYSITSAQDGLSGISLGAFLIKQVLDELRRELPQLSDFCTLSPIPGFADWLKQQIDNNPDSVLSISDRDKLAASTKKPFAQLVANPDWINNESINKAMEQILLPLATRYIIEEKTESGRAADSVAHFHLSNGALVERINWMGDTSANGIEQSFTIMINYRYDLDQIESNHEKYSAQGTIATSNLFKS